MPDSIKTTDPLHIQPVFVNQVVGTGNLNQVVNITFGTALFTPRQDGGDIDVDMVVSARLRMDVACATQLRDSLNALLNKLAPEKKHAPQEEKVLN